ncbi:MAG TPA: phospholipase, partial [Actinomycetota bacterium]|nr:phospholipase [Actinomycetota bacterium]
GADEHDLYPLFDMLDPERRLVGATPRGPLALPPGGAHWYVVQQVGFPDADTFFPTLDRARRWLDAFLESWGIPLERTVLGGFSQGAVMTYSIGLHPDTGRPAGLMPLSGFIPKVEGFEPDMTKAAGLPVAIGHGTFDPVISVRFGRAARTQMEEAGAEVTYRESPMQHGIDPAYLEDLRGWLTRAIEAAATP